MIGGWQWKDERMKNLMMKKNPIKSALKVLIPFKGIRKSIRQKIHDKHTLEVPRVSDEDRIMLKKRLNLL